MLRRRKWKPRTRLSWRQKLLIIIWMIIISIALMVWVINHSIQPVLIEFAEAQTTKIASMVLQKAINKEVTENLDIKDMMTTEGGQGGTTTFNAEAINKVLVEVTDLAEKNLDHAEAGSLKELEEALDVEIDADKMEHAEGISYTIPLGQITNNAILGNLGPRIPIRFHAIGDVSSDVKTKVEPFGINSAYVEVYIELQVHVQVIVPFAADETLVTQTIPVAMGLVHGTVPNYYNPNSVGISGK